MSLRPVKTTSANGSRESRPGRRTAAKAVGRGAAPKPSGNGHGSRATSIPPKDGALLVSPDGTPIDFSRYPVMGVRLYDVEALSLDPRNAREHDQAGIDLIRALLEEFGQRKNIVVDAKGVVKAGNGTLEAARQSGWKWIAGGPAPKTARAAKAYALGDNRSAEKSKWNESILGAELGSLAKSGYETDLLGWTESELDKLTGNALSMGAGVTRNPSGDGSSEVFQFRGVRVVISTQTADSLEAAMKRYADKRGTYNGFVEHAVACLNRTTP